MNNILREDIYKILIEDSAAQQAKKQGLLAKGGKWYDKAGKYIAKTVNDKLVKVSDQERQADAQKDKPKLITPNKDALSTWKRKGSDQSQQQEPQSQEPPRQMTDYERETTSTVSRVRDHFTKNEVRNTRYGDAIADHVYGLKDSQGSQAYIETIDEYREIEKSFDTPDILKNFTRTDSFMKSGHNMSMLSMMVNHPGQEENDYRYQRMVEYCKQPDADEETCQSFQNTNITDRDKEAFGRMMKNQQEGLRKLGLVNEDNTVTLYRGVKMDNKADDGKTSYMGSGVDSWTFEPSVARLFGKKRNDDNINILSCRVPLERVIASCFTTSHPKDIRDQNDGSPLRDWNNMEFMHYSEFECVIDSFALEDVSLHNVDNNEDESSWKQKYKELMKEEQNVDMSSVININNEENIDWIRSLEKEEDVNESFILEAETAAEKAKKLQYTSAPGGRWYNKTGQYVAKTVDDKLVPVTPQERYADEKEKRDDAKKSKVDRTPDDSYRQYVQPETELNVEQLKELGIEPDIAETLDSIGYGKGAVGITVISADASIQDYLNSDEVLENPPGNDSSRYNEVFSLIGTHIAFEHYRQTQGEVIDKDKLFDIIEKLYGETEFYKSANESNIRGTIEASITKLESVSNIVEKNKFDFTTTEIAPFWGTSESLSSQYDYIMTMKEIGDYVLKDSDGNIIKEVPQDFTTYKHMNGWNDPKTGKKLSIDEINRIRKDNDIWDFMALAAYNGGGGGNPSDTSFIIQDGNELTFVGFSDKTALSDQQANSTPATAFENMKMYVEFLKSNNYSFTEGLQEQIVNSITAAQEAFAQNEQKLSTIPLMPAIYMSEIFDDNQDYIMSLVNSKEAADPESNQKSVISRNKRIERFIEAASKNPNATINSTPGPDKGNNISPDSMAYWKEEITFAKYLKQAGWEEGEVSREQAVKAWLLLQSDDTEVPMVDKNGDEYTLTVSEAFSTVDDRKLMQYMLSAKTEDESGKSVNIIEKSSRGDFDESQNEKLEGVKNPFDIYNDLEKNRAESIGHVQQLYLDLNEIVVEDENGDERNMGDLIAAQDAIDQFHLYMIDQENAPSLYRYGMIELIAGSDRVTPESMAECLGTNDVKELMNNIKVKTPPKDGPKVEINGQTYYESQIQRTSPIKKKEVQKELISKNEQGQYTFRSPDSDEFIYVDEEDLDQVIDLIGGKIKDDKGKKAKIHNIGGRSLPNTLKPVGVITGRKALLYINDAEGNEMPIGEQIYRTKEGALGKLQTAYTFSKELQNCLGGKE